MTNLIKFSKGMLLAASLTFASLSVSANVNTTPGINQVNSDLIAVLQQAISAQVSAQISAIADEIDREIDIAIERGLIEFGLENNDSDKAGNEQKSVKGEEQ